MSRNSTCVGLIQRKSAFWLGTGSTLALLASLTFGLTVVPQVALAAECVPGGSPGGGGIDNGIATNTACGENAGFVGAFGIPGVQNTAVGAGAGQFVSG